MKRPAIRPTLFPSFLAALLLLASSVFAREDKTLAGGRVHGAVISDGRLFTMGKNDNGSLGIGSDTNYVTSPVLVSIGWRHVSASAHSTFGIKTDSTLWAWGQGNSGELGQGGTAHSNTPLQVGSDKWITVSANTQGYSILAIRSDSTLWGWGRNNVGQLGDGTTQARLAPVQIGTAKWLDVDAGEYHSMGIQADSTLWAWGDNSSGNLGDGTTDPQIAPVQIGTAKWRAVSAAGNSHSHGIQSDGTLWGWGKNTDYALGFTNNTASVLVPTQVGSDLWLSLDAHTKYVGAIRSDSTLWFWGSNRYDAAFGLEERGVDSSSTPVQMRSGKWTEVALGSENQTSFGRAASGLYYSWGNSEDGQTGTGEGNFDTPRLILKGSQTLTFPALPSKTWLDADFAPGATASSGLAVSYTSSDPTVATIVSGNIHLVGVGAATITASQAGDGTYDSAASVARTLTVGKASQTVVFTNANTVAYGETLNLSATAPGTGAVSYSLDADSLASIAGNELTALGTGSVTVTASVAADANYNAGSADQVVTLTKAGQSITFSALPAGKTWLDADFSPGATASSGLTVAYASSDAAVATIVSGSIHLVGAGTTTITASQDGDASYESAASVTRTLTVTHPPHPHQDRKVAGYGYGSLVIRDGIGLYGTGYNGSYALGLGDQTSRNRFHLIASGNWRHVEGGDVFSAALKEDSTLWVFGSHPLGFGDGATVHTTPAQVGTSRWIAVAMGMADMATLGIQADSTLWAWGEPGAYLFGDGIAEQRTAPVQVGSAKWLDLSHTSAHVLALKADHTLWAWGSAQNGKLGNGATSGTVTTPVQIGSDRWRMISAGYSHSIAIRSDSTLWTWGANTSGQTGLGTSSGNTTALTQVGSAKWIWVQRTYQGVAALKSDSTLWTWGSNTLGRLAQGGSSTLTTPTQVGTGKWRQVAMSQHHGIGLDSAGTVYTWGNNGNGELGDSSNTQRNSPVAAKFNRTQTITFPAFAAKTYGDADFAPGASTDAGTAITYASSNTAVATMVSGQIHIVGAGTTSITASAAGNVAYDARDSSQTLTVAKAGQTLSFTAPAAKSIGDADFAPGATASSGLAVSYTSSDTTVATIVSGQIRIVGAGSAVITASQAGDADYHAAPDSSHTLTVSKLPQTITFAALTAKTFGDGAFALGATAASGLAVTYTSSDTTVATVSGSTITLVGAGSAVITAHQAGNATYDSAAGVAHTLTVNKASQTLAFPALAAKTLGDADFAPGATATSGLTVTYASSDTSVATIVSGQIHLVGSGTATITASQAGNGNYNPASDAAQSLTVTKAAQSITFASLSARTFGDAAFTLGATATSGLAVSYASSNTAVATVSGSTVTLVGAGTADITASQAGNSIYLAAADAVQSITVNKANQSISFDPIAAKTLGDADFAPGASATSGLAVTYASSDTSVAAIVSGLIHLVGSGTATITASQAGNGNYDAAADVSQSLTVGKTSQTIAFSALAAKTYGDSAFALTGTASSGLAVSYASSNTAVATVSGSTVTVVGAGSTTITASQAGNSTYLAAADAVQSLTINKADQSILFSALPGKSLGDADFAPGAAATSGLSISYSSSDTMVAEIVSGQIRLVGAGTAAITAAQSGNTHYHAATPVTQSLSVGKSTQAITFAPLPAKTFGDSAFALAGTAGSGLAVSYVSSNPSVATVSGSTVTVVGAGTTDITASQAGNAAYLAASDVAQTLTVNKAGQTLTFAALPAKILGEADFALAASASSGLPVTYTSSDTLVAVVIAGQVRLKGAGTTVLTASQGGNANYQAAADITQSLSVGKASQTLTFTQPAARTYGDAAFTLEATASSGLPVTFASSDPAVVTVSGSTVTVVGAGTTVLTATQAGEGTWLAAPAVTRTLTVNKAGQTITFAALPAKTLGDADFAPGASTTSGLAMTYTSSDTTVATLVSGQVHLVGAGTATITASQAGDGNHVAATDVVRTLIVDKRAQSIAFDSLPTRTFGDSAFAPGATASSGLPVSYASSDPEVAAVIDGLVHLMGSGTATVTATQAGDAAHHAAPAVTQTLTVGKAFHTLVFTLGADTLKTVGDAAFRLKALSNVGLPVSYASSDTSVARVSGDSIILGKAGTAEVTAIQPGNNRYAAAPSVTRILRVRIAAPDALPLESLIPRAETAADTQVVLSWSRRAGAEGYQVQAILDPAGSTLVDRSVQDTSLPLGGLPFAAQVRWRVAPFNSTGQAAYSPDAAFQVRPAPPKPLDIARIPTYSEAGTATTVELTWPKADLATGYRIQVFLDTAQPPRIDTTVTDAALTLEDLPPGSAQIWRVAPVNGPSQAPFTPWLTFKVKEKDDGAVTKGIVVDSARPVQVSRVVTVAPNENQTGNVVLTLTEERQAPPNLPAGFQALTGNISLSASQGSAGLNDSQITITLSPPDTALDGTPVAGADQPLVYTLDSATGRLEVVYDLLRDSTGRIVLPLSKGKSFLLAVDTVPPVVKDGSSSEPRPAGSTGLVISGVIEDNIRNSRTMLRFRRGGSDTFDSLPVAIDAEGRFDLPLDLALDSTGFEYSITATDGRNVKSTPSANVPVEVAALKAADSLPSMQWRLFALPTLPKETRWEDLAPSLGTYGPDWKLFTRAAGGLKEFGPALEKAEAGVAYWLKSRKRGLRPSLAGGLVAPINKPFEVVVPPRSWLSFGNPFLFPVSWESVLDATQAAPGALAGPYTFRDTAWVSPLEIPALLPWEGYYAYNASDDTLRMRIPARKAKDVQPALAKAAFQLQWQVRGADGKDGGNWFGGLAPQSTPAPAGKVSAAGRSPAALSGPWHAPKPESPEGGLRAGFLSDAEGDGLLQTDFRAASPQGGLAWTARLSGLKPGHAYANRFQGFESLPAGMAVALADAATGHFVPWNAGVTYRVEVQAGEHSRELTFYAGSPEYVQSRGAEFKAAHPFAMELGNHPNPVRTYTVIDFAVPASAKGRQGITLSVIDMQGRLVKRLVSGPMATGRHSLRWDLGDERGQAVAAGSYRLLMEMGGRRMHRPLQVLP